jgi:hypothetical protein
MKSKLDLINFYILQPIFLAFNGFYLICQNFAVKGIKYIAISLNIKHLYGYLTTRSNLESSNKKKS